MKNIVHVTNSSELPSDVETYGDPDKWECVCKVWNSKEGWMKSTKRMYLPNGWLYQVTTEIKNPDGSKSVSEALTFIPKF